MPLWRKHVVWSLTYSQTCWSVKSSEHSLGSITMNKASGGDGIPAELFQILKDDVVKVLHSVYQQIWKTQQWLQDWKGQCSFQSQRKAMPKNVPNTVQLRSFHMLARLCSKSFKLGFSSTWSGELPDVHSRIVMSSWWITLLSTIKWPFLSLIYTLTLI